MGAQRCSPAEVNFTRLAKRMEEMARDRETAGWRFGRYLQALRARLGDLKRLEGALRPEEARLKYYEERVSTLQSMLAAEQKTSVQEKAELLDAVAVPAAAAVAAAAAATPGGGGIEEATARDAMFSREVLALSRAHLQAEERRELLSFAGSSDNADPSSTSDTALKRRGARLPDAGRGGADERALQDSLTENMLQLARALKQTAQVSGDTVRADLAKIRQLSDLSDTNYSRLKTESGRLEQQLSQQCNWLLWFMVALVAVTFVGMVMFMRLFSKKVRTAVPMANS